MKLKQIVLRNKPVIPTDSFGGGFSAISTESGILMNTSNRLFSMISVDLEEVSLEKLTSFTLDKSIDLTAPSIPTSLITPISLEDTSGNNTSTESAWGISAVGADLSSYTGQGIVVAILDTGIEKNHPAFEGLNIIEKDFTGEGNGDLNGHGTHCAGTIVGRPINGKRFGVAPGVEKLLVAKVLDKNGSGKSDMIAKAMEWAVGEGANVISMSIGFDFPRFVTQLTKEWKKEYKSFAGEMAVSFALSIYRANVRLFEKMVALYSSDATGFFQPLVFVGAAGNESHRGEDERLKFFVSPPASCEGFISVAALNKSANRYSVSTFSNTGVNIAAPGENILSAELGGGLSLKSGTSMATPHVAGIAALWAEKIKKEQKLTSNLLTAKILASGKVDNLMPGTDLSDVGAGIASAPIQ